MTDRHKRKLRAACRVYAKKGYLLSEIVRSSTLDLVFIKQYEHPVIETIGRVNFTDAYIFKVWAGYKGGEGCS